MYKCIYCDKEFSSNIECLEHIAAHPCIDCEHLSYDYYAELSCKYLKNKSCNAHMTDCKKYKERGNKT